MKVLRRKWEEKDDEFLLDNYEKMSKAEIASTLNTTTTAVYKRKQKLNNNDRTTTVLYEAHKEHKK